MRLKFVEPLLPTLVEEWIHEVKFDGYRSQIIIHHDVRIFTRNGYNWTAKYRDLAGASKRLGVESAFIDGEIVVLNEAGLSDCGRVADRPGWEPWCCSCASIDDFDLNVKDDIAG
ncbi:hypothetical protein HB778_31185 [Mesorhizobium huakuii]|uniref:ATP-dependent DNA ligase family profile domain-containing protein n=2 Tax=Mesorhizobium huakuii TaxID=28104 RepID=A0A7G6T3Z1_9HYPH|nr:hypothetical protein HB778_31185 [Mesorhizobium huakuii]